MNAIANSGRKQINLYQAEFRPPQLVLPTQSLLLGVVAFTVGLLLLHAWDIWKMHLFRQEADQIVARAESVENRLAQVSHAMNQAADPMVVAEAETLEARVRGLQQAQEAVASGVLGSETGFAAHFLALSHATVAGAWLTRIEVTGAGREVNLEGRALEGEAPARLIAALGRQPLLAGLSYAALDVHPPVREEGPQPADSPVKASEAPGFLEFTLSAQLAARQTPAGAPPSAGGSF